MDADEPELPRGVALAWGVAANPQRGPKREMSVERIVEAAMDIADAEGLGAVSMAAVAARLGYTPMSLYRYVSAKDDLTMLMQEAATGVPPASVAEVSGWRDRLLALFRAQVAVFLAHPWILDIPITGSPVTPNSAAFMETSLDALEDTPLSPEERIAVTLLVTGQSRWYGTILAAYARVARETGMNPEQITRMEDRLFATLIDGDEFPALRRAIDAGVFRSDADPFLFGIERILDGVAAYIADRDAGGPAHPPAAWMSAEDPALATDKRVREARKSVREAEKLLRDARKAERQALREAGERVARDRGAAH